MFAAKKIGRSGGILPHGGNSTAMQGRVPLSHSINLAEPKPFQSQSASAAPVVAVNKARFDNRSQSAKPAKSSENITFYNDFRDALRKVSGDDVSEALPVPKHAKPFHKSMPLFIQACINVNYDKDNLKYENHSRVRKFSTPAHGKLIPVRDNLYAKLQDDLLRISNGQFPVHAEWFHTYGRDITPSRANDLLAILNRISSLLQFTNEKNTWKGKGCDQMLSIMNALVIQNVLMPKTYSKQKYYSMFFHINEASYDEHQKRAITGMPKNLPLRNGKLPDLPFPSMMATDILRSHQSQSAIIYNVLSVALPRKVASSVSASTLAFNSAVSSQTPFMISKMFSSAVSSIYSSKSKSSAVSASSWSSSSTGSTGSTGSSSSSGGSGGLPDLSDTQSVAGRSSGGGGGYSAGYTRIYPDLGAQSESESSGEEAADQSFEQTSGPAGPPPPPPPGAGAVPVMTREAAITASIEVAAEPIRVDYFDSRIREVMSASIDDLLMRIQGMETELVDQRDALTELASEHQTISQNVSSMNRRFNNAEGLMDTLNDNMEAVKSSVGALSTKVDEWHTLVDPRIEDMQKQITNLNGGLQDGVTDRSILRTQLDTLQNDLRLAVSQLQNQISSLPAPVVNIAAPSGSSGGGKKGSGVSSAVMNSAMATQQKEFEKQITRLRSDMGRLERETNKVFESVSNESGLQSGNIAKILSDMNDLVARLKAFDSHTATENANLQGRVNDLNARMDSMENDRQAAASTPSVTRADIQQLRSELANDLNSIITTSARDRSISKKEIDDLRNAIKGLTTHEQFIALETKISQLSRNETDDAVIQKLVSMEGKLMSLGARQDATDAGSDNVKKLVDSLKPHFDQKLESLGRMFQARDNEIRKLEAQVRGQQLMGMARQAEATLAAADVNAASIAGRNNPTDFPVSVVSIQADSVRDRNMPSGPSSSRHNFITPSSSSALESMGKYYKSKFASFNFKQVGPQKDVSSIARPQSLTPGASTSSRRNQQADDGDMNPMAGADDYDHADPTNMQDEPAATVHPNIAPIVAALPRRSVRLQSAAASARIHYQVAVKKDAKDVPAPRKKKRVSTQGREVLRKKPGNMGKEYHFEEGEFEE